MTSQGQGPRPRTTTLPTDEHDLEITRSAAHVCRRGGIGVLVLLDVIYACCRQVKTDNTTWVNMPDDFPSEPKVRGPDYVITLRIPRFNSTMFYDPVMSNTGEEGEIEEVPTRTDPPGAGTGTAICATFVPLCAGLLLTFAATKFTL